MFSLAEKLKPIGEPKCVDSKYNEQGDVVIDEAIKFDPIERPQHYASGQIQPIDFIEAQNILDFRLANSIKYIARCQKKGTEIEDIRKAIWYLKRYLKIKHGIQE